MYICRTNNNKHTVMKQKIAFAIIMGAITTGIISFTLISINIGYSALFVGIWLRSWSVAYMVAIPTILLVGPKVQKVVDRLFVTAAEPE